MSKNRQWKPGDRLCLRWRRMLLEQLGQVFELQLYLGFHHRRIERGSTVLHAPARDRNDPVFEWVELIPCSRPNRRSLFLNKRMLRGYAAFGNNIRRVSWLF